MSPLVTAFFPDAARYADSSGGSVFVRAGVDAGKSPGEGLNEFLGVSEHHGKSQRDVQVATAAGGLVFDPAHVVGREPGPQPAVVVVDFVLAAAADVQVQAKGTNHSVPAAGPHGSRE